MSSFFENLIASEKNSVHQSMKSMIRSFVDDFRYDSPLTTKTLVALETDFVDEIYFLWFQLSAYREYRWTQSFSTLYFTIPFSREMKQILKFHLYEYVKGTENESTNYDKIQNKKNHIA